MLICLNEQERLLTVDCVGSWNWFPTSGPGTVETLRLFLFTSSVKEPDEKVKTKTRSRWNIGDKKFPVRLEIITFVKFYVGELILTQLFGALGHLNMNHTYLFNKLNCFEWFYQLRQRKFLDISKYLHYLSYHLLLEYNFFLPYSKNSSSWICNNLNFKVRQSKCMTMVRPDRF